MRRLLISATLALFALTGAACDSSDPGTTGDTAADGTKGSSGKSDASAVAAFVDMEFDGELLADTCWDPNSSIDTQMLYSVGQLNGDNSVGRLDSVTLTDVETEQTEGGCRITYHARLPVAWGDKFNVPSRYAFKMPRDVSFAGQKRFVEAYGHDCVDWGAHDVTAGIMWYYFRPARSGCSLGDDDIHVFDAEVSESPIHTTGKYPEYHKVWEDNVFKVVAVFGKYEDGATSGDAGISAYNTFLGAIKSEFKSADLVTTPESVPNNPGVDLTDVTFVGTLDDGRRIEVVALLIDSVGTADSTFRNRYEGLTPDADLVVYNGHAGLGSNIRKLAQMGDWVTGQYVVVFMNGCDTYAYLDSALYEAHADVNDDDSVGTKYVDLVANAMPSFFRSMSAATMALIRGLADYDEPKTYEQMFKDIDDAEVVIVSGENDNEYYPGLEVEGGGSDEPVSGWDWAGLQDSGEVAKGKALQYDLGKLEAGRYAFVMDGTGDADLYVRLGEQPTADAFDCRPFSVGSKETCEVTLDAATPVHVMVAGWADNSTFELTGEKLD